MNRRILSTVCLWRMLVVSTLLAGSVAPLSAQQATESAAHIVASAERAAVHAVNFREGDAEGLAANRSEFTDDAWKGFIDHMQGFLDENGSPTFTSSFVASGPAKVLDETNGTVRFRIPGTLTQSNKLGKTTYRAALEVTAGGEPIKIQKLEQITCVGSSRACQ